MATLNRIEEADIVFRAKQLRDLCDDFLRRKSDEFYSEEEKVINICKTSKLFLEQAVAEYGTNELTVEHDD